MIYYFSGTGNSKWIAEELARRTGDQARNIAVLMRDGAAEVSAKEHSKIGIVFPVYAWGAPLLVERFCKSLRVDEGAYAYAVCTCGDEAGRAMLRLKRFFPLQSAWSFAMPNNYIIGFDVDSPALEEQKINAARERLIHVSESIRAGKAEYDVHAGGAAWWKTALIRPMFNAFARRTKPFSVTNACNGCKICERGCPIGAISMEHGKPVWVLKQCTQCMACINRCPKRAIQYARGTIQRGRYFFAEPKAPENA